jgi:hypothetical protein
VKKSLLKIAAPTLALGLTFAPVVNAAPQETTQKTVLTVTKTTVSKNVSAKEKDAAKRLASINKNISKVETNVNYLSKITTEFYAKATTISVPTKVEASFYASVSGKLKANTNQLKALKKQVANVAKKYKGTEAVNAANKEIAELNAAISATSKTLKELHSQFKSTLTEQEAKERFTTITNEVFKVETSVAALSKATGDFYTRAAVDATVTAKVEADFYTSTSAQLKANKDSLETLKKQLDFVAKFHKDAAAVAVVSSKMADITTALQTSSKNLTDLHNQFVAKVKEQEAKDKVTFVMNEAFKLETSVAALTKATADFYARAATDATVTAKVEADFYASTSTQLKTNANLLVSLNKQLDSVASYYKDTAALAVVYKKVTDVTTANSVASKTLNDLHTQFVANAKQQEAKAKLAAITTEVSKVEATVAELSKATVDFYTKAAVDATITAKVESAYYTSTASKFKTTVNQLVALKKQVDTVAKTYKDVDTVAAYKKIADLNTVIATANKQLTDLHDQFVAKLKEQEAKAKLTLITNEITKVETNVAALSKATVDFYTKAATDSKVTIQVEADFYKRTSGSLLDNTRQLLVIQQQLDQFVKTYGQSADVTAAYAKITSQNQAISTAVEVLIKLHTTFKPVTPTTTNP